MNKNQKNWVRLAVLSALLAWPSVEVYRTIKVREQLAASQQLEKSVLKRLDKVRADRAAKLAKAGTTSVTSTVAK